MTTYLKDFNEGTNGAAITVTGDVIAVTGSPTFTNSAKHGAMAAAFTGTTAIARLQLPFTGNHKGSFYFRIDSGPASSAVRIMRITTATNTVCADIRVHSSGKFDIANTTGSVATTGTYTWTTASWYRCDYMWTETIGGNSTISLRFFADSETETQVDAFSATYASQTATAARLMIGSQAGTGGTATITTDTIRCDTDMTSWYSAFAPSAAPPGTLNSSWVCATAPGSFTVKAKVTSGTSCRLKVGTNSGLTTGVSYFGPVTPDSDGYVTLVASSLTTDARYYWSVTDTPTGGLEQLIGTVGSVQTPVIGTTGFVFAFGSASANAGNGAAFADIQSYNPDFFIHMGDFHTNASASSTAATQRGFYETQIGAIAALKEMITKVSTFYIRSDRDGGGAAHAEKSSAYQASQAAVKKLVPLPTLANPELDSLHYSWVAGRIRFIALDTRNMYRSPGTDAQSSTKTLLGATQKAWLFDQLSASEPVKVIISDVPWFGSASLSNPDWWRAYDNERSEIGLWIQSHGTRVLMLTGDQNSIVADNGINNSWGGFPVIGCAPLTDVGVASIVGTYQSTYTKDGSTEGRHYGKVTVSDDGEIIEFDFAGYDVQSATNRVTLVTEFNTVGTASFKEWNGSTLHDLNFAGIWDGSTIVPGNFNSIYG